MVRCIVVSKTKAATNMKMFAHIRAALNNGVSSGVLKHIPGTGANGSFNIMKDKVDEPKKKAAVVPQKKTDVAVKKKSGAAVMNVTKKAVADAASKKKSGAAVTKKAATGTASKKQSVTVVKKVTKNAAAVKPVGATKAAPKNSRAGIVKTANDVNKPAEIKKATGSKSRPAK